MADADAVTDALGTLFQRMNDKTRGKRPSNGSLSGRFRRGGFFEKVKATAVRMPVVTM